jgi:hypothetical protein
MEDQASAVCRPKLLLKSQFSDKALRDTARENPEHSTSSVASSSNSSGPSGGALHQLKGDLPP